LRLGLLLRLLVCRLLVAASPRAADHRTDRRALATMPSGDLADNGTARRTSHALAAAYRRTGLLWRLRRRQVRRVDAGGLLRPHLAFALIAILLLAALPFGRVENRLLILRCNRE
jgi:hypothetical protein